MIELETNTQTESGIYLPPTYTYYVKSTEQSISQRKLEGLQKLAEIKQWGLRNPTKFMETFMGVSLLDAQTYVFMNSWITPYCLWLESRGGGKSTKLALFLMTKGLLINNYWAYISSGTADQSIETFKKIEDITMKNIESMTGLTDVFKNELVINQANSSGFVHNPMGFTYYLYNGAFVKTINSNIDKKRGKRSNIVVFDEGSWLTDEIFNVIGAFTSVSKDFKLGGDVQVSALPRGIPNQLLYASSASSVDTAFYKKYRDFSKKMMLGDNRYFVADINCDIVINATYKGKIYPASLLTRETVEAEYRNNPEKCMREYYNRFTLEGQIGQIIKRSMIARNSYTRPPVLYNDTNKRKFVLAYDPARQIDNSTVGVGEIIWDEKVGYRMEIVNSVNFMDLGIRKKKPMTTPDQIKALKQMMLDYNGKQVTDYENIFVLADAGSGGGGHLIFDFFMQDWYEEGHENNDNFKHKGLVDEVYSEDYVRRYPNASHNVKLIKPSELKAEMFESLIKMMEADLITFPANYDNHGYLNLLEVNDELLATKKAELLEQGLTDEEVMERLCELDIAKTTMYKLTPDEEVALSQIDAMKEEIINICRIKRDGGKDGFKLPPTKDADTGNSEATLHDDRAYTLAMLGWYLSELRRQDIIKKQRPKIDNLASKMLITKPKIHGSKGKIIG